MRFELLYSCQTRAGTFYVGIAPDGWFHPVYNGQSYGRYAKPWQAAEDLSQNATFPVHDQSTGERLDTSSIGIGPGLSQWERMASASRRASATLTRKRNVS